MLMIDCFYASFCLHKTEFSYLPMWLVHVVKDFSQEYAACVSNELHNIVSGGFHKLCFSFFFVLDNICLSV